LPAFSDGAPGQDNGITGRGSGRLDVDLRAFNESMDIYGRTPLHWMCLHGDHAVAEILTAREIRQYSASQLLTAKDVLAHHVKLQVYQCPGRVIGDVRPLQGLGNNVDAEPAWAQRRNR